MTPKIQFFSASGVKYIHTMQIRLFGGLDGIRDKGLLESAVAMPRATFDGKFIHQDLIEMSAAYIFHLIKNHAFLDANKRTGIMTGLAFLRINNVAISMSRKQMVDLAVGVADSRISKEQLIEQLRVMVSSRKTK